MAEEGEALLVQIATSMARAQKEFFGKGPSHAKAYMLDDMLLIVMRGSLTPAEQTMLEFGETDQVRQFRQLFENRMTERLTGMVEELTERKVLTCQSQIMFEPDVVVEIFMFESDGSPAAVRAAAEAKFDDEHAGAPGGSGA
jgi:uncharacterized protein YbcI